MKEYKNICSICGEPLEGYGNSSEPINIGRCCDKCNIEVVVPARIKALTEEPKYMIVAMCDPYNARFHHHDERVIKYNMTTPVEWVINDGYGEGLSKAEALHELYMMAAADFYEESEHFNAADLPQYIEDYRENHPEVDEVDTSWFKGDGWYSLESQYPLFLNGDESYRHDVMTYQITEYIPE